MNSDLFVDEEAADFNNESSSLLDPNFNNLKREYYSSPRDRSKFDRWRKL